MPRSLFLQTMDTPNPASVKILPGIPVLDASKTGGITSVNIPSPLESYKSPLAKALFKVDGVRGVYLGPDFITVTIDLDNYKWDDLYFFIFEAISNFFESGRPILALDAEQSQDTIVNEEDDEVIIAIKEILETKIRPMVQEDGGDVHLVKFEDGIVYLQMQGSCSSCPSSVVTLKHGIENMLMHYIPEVEEVREWQDADVEKASEEQLNKVEQKAQAV